MGFQRTIPANVGELKEYLNKMHENRKHVSSVKVNPATNHLEIDLSGMANFAGYPDVYLPIKKGKVEQAKELVERMLTQSAGGYLPSDTDVEALFGMVDPLAR